MSLQSALTLPGGKFAATLTATDPHETTTGQARTITLLVDGKAVLTKKFSDSAGKTGVTASGTVSIGLGKHTLAVHIVSDVTTAPVVGSYAGSVTFKGAGPLGGVVPAKPIAFSGVTPKVPFSTEILVIPGRVLTAPSGLPKLGGGGAVGGIKLGGQVAIGGTVSATHPTDTATARTWTVLIDGKSVATGAVKSGGSLTVKPTNVSVGKHVVSLKIGASGAYSGSYTGTFDVIGGPLGQKKKLHFSSITASAAGTLPVFAIPLGFILPGSIASSQIGGVVKGGGILGQDVSGIRPGIGATNPFPRWWGLPNPSGPYVHQAIEDAQDTTTTSDDSSLFEQGVKYVGVGRENALYAATLRNVKGTGGIPGWGETEQGSTPNVEVGRREPKQLTGGISDIAIHRR